MTPAMQAYRMGRAACLFGRHMIDDTRFGYLMQTVGLLRGMVLAISWRKGYRDAARCR